VLVEFWSELVCVNEVFVQIGLNMVQQNLSSVAHYFQRLLALRVCLVLTDYRVYKLGDAAQRRYHFV
jgi:hypothetical protein